MIAHSRRSTPRLPLTRDFEFTRLETQLLAHAYQELIPIISRRSEQPRSHHGNNKSAMTTIQTPRSEAGGA